MGQFEDQAPAGDPLRVVYFSNEFPNDDLQTLLRRLHVLSRASQYATLQKFLDEATRVVHEEVHDLTAELQKLVPAFTSVISFAADAELRKSRLNPSIDGVLHCVLQLGTYIAHCESSGSDPQVPSFSLETVLSALGLGMLSCAAVSLAPTTKDLPWVAAEAVRIAFRLGVHVTNVARSLEVQETEGPPESWAHVVNGCNPEDAQKELDSIQSEGDGPDTAKIFISAISETSVTISGPPGRLNTLFKTSGFFRDRTHLALPVYGGLCHAEHIYSMEDVRTVLAGTQLDGRYKAGKTVYQTSTGEPFTGKSSTELLEQVVYEIMTQKIIWDNVVAGIVNHAVSKASTRVNVSIFRSSLPVNGLVSSLEASLPDASVEKSDLIGWLMNQEPEKFAPRGKLAIVGMSCRLPGGSTSNDKFWEVLEQGLDVSREIPADRFDIATHYDPTGKDMNKTATKYGCFIDEPGLFDAPFFNISPKEAKTLDPQMRLALVTAHEALEQSGYVKNRTAATRTERIGTFYGQAADDYREVNQGQEVSTYYIPGGCRAFGPGRINHFFKFSGPSYSIDTACSSGLAAVEVACQSLWSGACDTAVTGGLNVLTNPDGFAGLGSGHFLTKGHNACKTWDASADGYCRADGVVSFVIKRYEDAIADNDRMLGVILGAGTNHSAEAASITYPHAGHQAYLSRQTLRQAHVDPLMVSYIEFHGTGTQAGDWEEMSGILDVYAPLKGRRSKSQPLHIGSVKSNVGHGESVAGATSLLKVLIMLQKNAIPRHVGIKTEINPRFPTDFDKRNLHIPFEQTPWLPATDRRRIAVVNSFGAAGGNTTMVLEEAFNTPASEDDPRPSHVITVSAKCKEALQGNIERLIGFLNRPENQDISLADLSYTLTARRAAYNHRITFATNSIEGVKKSLASKLENVANVKPISSTHEVSVAMVFTGQGASDKSMNLQLYHHSDIFRSEIQTLDLLAQRQGFPSFIPAIDGSFEKDHQHSPVITQVSLTCVEIALAKYWESLGIKPDVVMGHSLGEYAALCVAGVLSASDAIFLCGYRAALMEERCKQGTHKMMAVEASVDYIKEASNGLPYEVACINGPQKTVVAGPLEELEALQKPLSEKGYRCVIMDVAFAFHSAQTDPVLADYQERAKKGALFQAPKVPVISPLLGSVVFDDKSLNAEYVTRATREPVNFLAALRRAEELSIVDEETAWIEIGPHPVCLSFVKACLPFKAPASVPSLRRGEDNYASLANSLAELHNIGAVLNWSEFHGPFEKNLRVLDLPTYAWNEKTYWLQYQGDWALTKGNTFYTTGQAQNTNTGSRFSTSSIKTSTVHEVIEEEYDGNYGKVVMQSDLMQPELLSAAHGHSMNGCGVVTSSIHGDIAFTLADHLHKKLLPKDKDFQMNITNLEVVKGLVAQSDTSTPQVFQVSAETADIKSGIVKLEWHNVDAQLNVQDCFATATVVYGKPSEWLNSWVPFTHLVQSRIDALDQMTKEGKANIFSQKMAYRIFAGLVDYAEKYQGMKQVVIADYEAYADVELTTSGSGSYTVPPYFIDSVAHLAGFIMNGSDSSDTKNTFCVTPGWKSMRFAAPLVAGNRYRSYVKMIPDAEDENTYFGDVYILQNNVIVGLVGGITFHRYPRILLNRFFSPPDKAQAGGSKDQAKAPAKAAAPSKAPAKKAAPPKEEAKPAPAQPKEEEQASDSSSSEGDSASDTPGTSVTSGDKGDSGAAKDDPDSTVNKALDLIATEVGVDRSELQDDTNFTNIGVDSLLGLVLSEKFRDELDISVAGSLFLEYPTIGELKGWLDANHS